MSNMPFRSNASKSADDASNTNRCPDVHDDSDHAVAVSSHIDKALARLSTFDEPAERRGLSHVSA